MAFVPLLSAKDIFDLTVALLTNIGAIFTVGAYSYWYWRLRQDSNTNLRPLILGVAVGKAAVWFWSLSGILLITVDDWTLPSGSLPARMFFLAAVWMHVWVVWRIHQPPRGELLPGPFEILAAKQGKILVVEDEEALGRVYCHALTGDGYAAETVRTGEAALIYADRYKPDLILTDMLLPDMDGITLIEHARSMGFLGAAVAMSGAMPRFDQSQLGLFSETLLKPLTVQQLLDAVKRALNPPKIAGDC